MKICYMFFGFVVLCLFSGSALAAPLGPVLAALAPYLAPVATAATAIGTYAAPIATAIGAGTGIYSAVSQANAASKQAKQVKRSAGIQAKLQTQRLEDQRQQQEKQRQDTINAYQSTQTGTGGEEPVVEIEPRGPTEEQIRSAQRRSIDAQRGRSGRRSTILSRRGSAGARRTTLG